MAQSAYPITGANFTEADWQALNSAKPGIVGDMNATSFAWGTPNGDNAVIGAGLARVGGYGFRITGTQEIAVPTGANNYLIVARFNSANTKVLPGPVQLACLTGTSYNALTELPLWQITRTAGQALSNATVTDQRHWVGESVVIAAGATVPSLPKGSQINSGLQADVNSMELDAHFGHLQHRLDTTDQAVIAAAKKADAAQAATVAGNTALTNAATADGKAVAAQNTANTAITQITEAETKNELAFVHLQHRIDTNAYDLAAARKVADAGLANAATADGKAVAAQTTATKALGRQGTVNLTNSGEWPFNTSGATVTIPSQGSVAYLITTEVTSADGEVGEINITDKTATGFKLTFTGSARAVTVRWHTIAE